MCVRGVQNQNPQTRRRRLGHPKAKYETKFAWLLWRVDYGDGLDHAHPACWPLVVRGDQPEWPLRGWNWGAVHRVRDDYVGFLNSGIELGAGEDHAILVRRQNQNIALKATTLGLSRTGRPGSTSRSTSSRSTSNGWQRDERVRVGRGGDRRHPRRQDGHPRRRRRPRERRRPRHGRGARHAEAINFMATHGRGLICLTLTEEQVRAARPADDDSRGNGPAARHGVHREHRGARRSDDRDQRRRSRAHDRASRSTRRAPGRPRHARPRLPAPRAQRAACSCAPGRPRRSVDLARLAGLTPAGVICEIMNEDGTMARDARPCAVPTRFPSIRSRAVQRCTAREEPGL